MGVVRRAGAWRLEKRREGVYEITRDRAVRERVVTPEGEGIAELDVGPVGVPVRRVESFEEVLGRFEAYAHDRSRGEEDVPRPGPVTRVDRSGPVAEDLAAMDELALEDTPPGLVAVALLGVGGIFLWTSGIAPASWVFRIGVAAVAGGGLVVAWAVVSTESLGAALATLATAPSGAVDEGDGTDDDFERAPPVRKPVRDELYLDRADQRCEWCGEHIDFPEVHHITPRAEGGSNERSNLIVLCPEHHRLADGGGIAQSTLRAKVSRQEGEG